MISPWIALAQKRLIRDELLEMAPAWPSADFSTGERPGLGAARARRRG